MNSREARAKSHKGRIKVAGTRPGACAIGGAENASRIAVRVTISNHIVIATAANASQTLAAFKSLVRARAISDGIP
jgi:hypothetical protein